MYKKGIRQLNILIVSLSCCISLATTAQVQHIIPTSPEAATFSKVANYPMSTNTGLPNISIPLQDVEIGGLKIPISLDYHSGGFKVGEKSTNVGLGWSLSTDLQIARSINGVDDFGTFGYMANPNMRPRIANDGGDINYVAPVESQTNSDMYSYAAGLRDGKPDKFNYRLLNRSGSFYMLNNSGVISYLPVPYDNIKISYTPGQFTITDVDGTVYYFGASGVGYGDTAHLAQEGHEVTGSINQVTGSYGGSINSSITAWKCMRIVNSTNTDEVDFNYSNKSISTSTESTDFVEVFTSNTAPCNTLVYPNSTAATTATSYTNLLSHSAGFQNLSSPSYIEYLNGFGTGFHMLWINPAHNNQQEDKVFPYDVLNNPQRSARNNIGSITLSSITFRGGSIVFNGTDQLGSIVVQNEGQEVKTIRFYQSYTQAGNMPAAKTYNGSNFKGTLYLDSVSITNGADKYNTYAFLYKNKYCFGSHLKGHDAWGYVNARTVEIAMASSVPVYPAQDITPSYHDNTCFATTLAVHLNGNGDEFPDEELMQNGTLSTVIYPTGGYANFDYEANRYSFSSSDADGPSKRLLLGGGLRLQKISYYDGINAFTPVRQQYYTYGDLEDGEGIILNPPVIKNVDGSLVYGNYSFSQSEYYGTSNTQLTNAGSEPGGYSPGSFPGFYIPCASNNCILLINKILKTTYLPNSSMDHSYEGGSPIYYNKITEYNLDYGRQTGKTVHSYYPANYFIDAAYSPLGSSYLLGTDQKFMRESWFLGNLKSEAYYKYQTSSGSYGLVHQNSYEYTTILAPLFPRAIYSFVQNVFNITEPGSAASYSAYFNTPFNTGSFLINTPNFIFGESGVPIGKMLMSKKTEQWADDAGNLLSNIYQYTYNSRNDLASTQSSDSKGSTKIEYLTYPYDYPSDPVYQQMVARNMLSSVIERYQIAGGTRELVRHKTQYAFRNSLFYVPDATLSSFNGRPLELETNFDAYDNFGNVQQLTGRDGVVKSYFWGYESRYPVAEVKGINYPNALNGSGINMAVLINPSSDAQARTELNKLRNIPGTTLVNTFTYKPMTGVTSITNPAGISSYFEYDGINRLLDVRDNDNNLVTKYSYSLHGALPISRFYTNHPVIGTVCNCYVEPVTGPGNTYVIAGGTTTGTTTFFADNAAIQQMDANLGSPGPSATCANDTSVHKAIIALNTQIFLPLSGNVRPTGLLVEFLQNGHVVASRIFPTDDITTKYLYLTPGDYQVSLRVAPSFRYKALKFSFSGGGFLVSGNTITLQDHITYNIQATNFF